jgi:exodeoxyribonuclease-3
MNPLFNDEGRCIMTDHGSFVLFNIYFPNAGTGDDRLAYKMKFYEAFREHCQQLKITGKRIIVTGDVNTAHKEIDLWNAKFYKDFTGFLPQERAWIDSFLSDGFVDAYRHFYPDKANAYTFWDMRTMKRPANQGWRIDYFFVTKDLMESVERCEIFPEVMGSDHCPICLDLNLSDQRSDFSTPDNAGNLRPEFKKVIAIPDSRILLT